MRNNYAYIDPDYVYTDTGSGVLKNIAGITEQSALEFFESAAVTKRIKELKNRPVKIKDSTTLLFIHKYLFQDVYSWAGQERVVEIGKDGKQFFPTVRFEMAFSYINSLLTEYWAIKKADKPQIAEKLAVILDAVNFLHPFREGNGRAQREFIRVLALEKGYKMNYPAVSAAG